MTTPWRLVLKNEHREATKVWHVEFRLGRRTFRASTRHTDRAKAELEASLVYERKMMLATEHSMSASKCPPLGEALRRYMASDRFVDERARGVLPMIAGMIGKDTPLNALTKKQVDEWIKKRYTLVAYPTMLRELRIAKTFWKWAVIQGYTGVRDVRPFHGHHIPKDIDYSPCRPAMPVGRCAKILEATRNESTLGPLLHLCFWAASEVSAACKVTAGDISFEEDWILIRGSKNKLRTAKVPLLPPLKELLLERGVKDMAPDAHVVTRGRHYYYAGATGPTYVTVCRELRVWNSNALVAKDPELAIPGFHIFRHTMATQLALQGVPEREIALFLRHSPTSGVARRYYIERTPNDVRTRELLFALWRTPNNDTNDPKEVA